MIHHYPFDSTMQRIPLEYCCILEQRNTLCKGAVRRERAMEVSPSGNLVLVVDQLDSRATQSNCPNLIHAELQRETTSITDFSRADGRFWFCWITLHTDQECLVTALTRSDQLIINGTSGAAFLHLPDNEPVFCWEAAYPNPLQSAILAVEGQYLGSPPEIKLVKIIGADTEISAIGAIEIGDSQLLGWSTPDTLEFVRECEVRRSDGRRVDALTFEEQEAIMTRRIMWASLSREEKLRRFPTDHDLLTYLNIEYRREVYEVNVAVELGLSSFPD